MQCGRLSAQYLREWGLVMPVLPADWPTRVRVTDLYCESCKIKADTTLAKCNGVCAAVTAHRVQARAVTTPNVLLVQVQRPSAEGNLHKFNVDIEDLLQLPGMDALELAAVVYHDGTNVSTGHYWCVCRNVDGHFWRFDDAKVPSRCFSKDLRTKERDVYMLVYTRPRGGSVFAGASSDQSRHSGSHEGDRGAVRDGLVGRPAGGGDDAREAREPSAGENMARTSPTGRERESGVIMSAKAMGTPQTRKRVELLIPEGPPRVHVPGGVPDVLGEAREIPAPTRLLMIEDGPVPRRRSPTPELSEIEMERSATVVQRPSLRESSRRAAEAADLRRAAAESRGIGDLEKVNKMRRVSEQASMADTRRDPHRASEWTLYTPRSIDLTRCMARTWNDGKGGQCGKPKRPGGRFCLFHAKQEGEKGWHGAVDGDIPLGKLVEFRRKRARVEKGAAAGAPGALLGSGTDTGANTEDGHVRDPAAQAAAGGESGTDSALAGVEVSAPSSFSAHRASGNQGAGSTEATSTSAAPQGLALGSPPEVDFLEALDPGTTLLASPEVDVRRTLGYREDSSLPIDRKVGSLRNTGNTCYLNSLLHALGSLPRVVLWACGHEQLAEDMPGHDRNRCQLCLFAKDIRHIRSAQDARPVEPATVATRRQWSQGAFGSTRQQDVEEAFRLLGTSLDEVDRALLFAREPIRARRHDGLNSVRYSTPFWSIFGGVQRSIVSCPNRDCGYRTRKYEPIAHVTLEIPGEGWAVGDLLQHYFEEEVPPDYRCNGCGREGICTKKLDMERWPKVLCLHLKRFAWRRNRREKIYDKVVFHEQERVSENGPSYRLRSVCDHRGVAGGGHYVSYVRGHGGVWYFCDDSQRPTRIDVSRVLNSEGYMLFYECEQ